MITEADIRNALDGSFRRFVYSERGVAVETARVRADFMPDYGLLISSAGGPGNLDAETRSAIARKAYATRKALGNAPNGRKAVNA